MGRPFVLPLLLVLSLASGATAETLSMKGVMSPKEQIYYEFPTSDKHFVLFVKREGTLEGAGLLNGAVGVEYGMHDIYPGVGGSPRGYLIATLKNGDQAVVEWEVQATFIPGPDGKPQLLDNGVWKFIGGTGSLKGLQGAGIMHIKAVNPKDRLFSFEGEYVVKRP